MPSSHTFSVALTSSLQANYAVGADFGFRITITAASPSSDLQNLPSNAANAAGAATSAAAVFRYVQKPVSPDGTIESVFSGVCSYPDYIENPLVNAPIDANPANFRYNVIDLIVESETVANQVWMLIQTQVQQLMQTIADGQFLISGPSYTATASSTY